MRALSDRPSIRVTLSTYTVGTPNSLPAHAKGTATPAPVVRIAAGRSSRSTRAARRRFRSRFGMFRLVGLCACSTRSSLRSDLASDLSNVTQTSTWSARVSATRIEFDISIQNLGGHKLPTAYPSRRVWLHVRVRDGAGRTVFESGAVGPNGLIEGNDNDVDPLKYEPHYTEIREPQDVQIYESIMTGPDGRPTTGLLTAVQFIKDNRLLPRGFDKTSAEADIAVRGDAFRDTDFTGGGDRTQFSIDVGASSGPFEIEALLYYQPISFRWAQNLQWYEAAETRRFVSYFNAMSAGSAEVLARSTVKFRRLN